MISIILISILFVIFFAVSIITFFSGERGLVVYLLVIVSLILLAAVIKMIYNVKKYGKENVFRVFKKNQKVADRRSIFIDSLLSQINSKVFFSKTNPNIFLIINQNGLMLYSFLSMEGSLFGEGSKWYCKNGRAQYEISDPNLDLSEEENKVNHIVNVPVVSYFVLDTQTSLLSLSARYPILNVQTAPYNLCRTDMMMRLTDENIMYLSNMITASGCYEEAKR